MPAPEAISPSVPHCSFRKSKRKVRLLYSSKKELQRSRTRRREANGSKTTPIVYCCALGVEEAGSVDVKIARTDEVELLDICSPGASPNTQVSILPSN